ncbi:MAG: hypothetical protein ACKVHQ_09190 [Gammaproteobacteria bacterium]
MKILHRLLISLMLVSSQPAHADHVGFLADSLDQIESQYSNEPFLLVLWEINCFPCHEELETLGVLKQSHPNIERLRYSIDPDWFGELPRNYFYDANSSRIGFSGKLTEDILLEWLSM